MTLKIIAHSVCRLCIIKIKDVDGFQSVALKVRGIDFFEENALLSDNLHDLKSVEQQVVKTIDNSLQRKWT